MRGKSPPSLIFRDYDIRGKVGSQLTFRLAYLIGRAFGTLLYEISAPYVCLARDGRLSSEELEENFVKGLLDCGITVTCLGLGPTPFLYWAEQFLECDAGVMITGSHNPPHENGFKFSVKKVPFYGAQIRKIFKLIETKAFRNGKGILTSLVVLEEYCRYLLSLLTWGERKLTIAWDLGNGVSGVVLEKILSKIPGKHFLIHEKVDGRFLHRSPDPSIPGSLDSLCQLVLENECDLGLAFDGDGDRLSVVDNLGRVWEGDETLVFFAENILKKKPNTLVTLDIKASQVLFNHIKSLGGRPQLCRTGHVYMKEAMIRCNSLLGGEVSGHFFFRDSHMGFDDGLYAALRLISILTYSFSSLGSWYDCLPARYSTPELRVPCEEALKFQIIEKIKQQLYKDNILFEDMDGMRVSNEAGWWLLRASHTQDVLVMRYEALTLKGLAKIKHQLKSYLKDYNISLPDI